MKLHFTSISLFLCSVSTANAHISSHMHVSTMEEEVDGHVDMFNSKIERTPSPERIIPVANPFACMRVLENSDVVAGSCSNGNAVYWTYDDSTLQFKYNGSNMCLNAGKGQHQTATISRCNNSTRQKWDKTSQIFSLSSSQCLKLSLKTRNFNLRSCGSGDQFLFEYKRANSISENQNVE